VEWTSHPRFSEIEKQFFAMEAEEFADLEPGGWVIELTSSTLPCSRGIPLCARARCALHARELGCMIV
jgi:hypothetical protein